MKQNMEDGFDANWYVEHYPDLMKAIGRNPAQLLRHWRTHGKAEGRSCCPGSDISKTGFWTFGGQRFQGEHAFDPPLCSAILQFAQRVSAERMYDFGCGPGKYVAAFHDAGIHSTGFDGNPHTAAIPHCQVQDLTEKTFQKDKVPFVLSLEVGEHIPKQYETDFVTNLTNHVQDNGFLVLSWAVQGQGGTGHVNEQNNDYVTKLFESRGFQSLKEEADRLRKVSTLPWFKHTIMVFQKRA